MTSLVDAVKLLDLHHNAMRRFFLLASLVLVNYVNVQLCAAAPSSGDADPRPLTLLSAVGSEALGEVGRSREHTSCPR